MQVYDLNMPQKRGKIKNNFERYETDERFIRT